MEKLKPPGALARRYITPGLGSSSVDYLATQVRDDVVTTGVSFLG